MESLPDPGKALARRHKMLHEIISCNISFNAKSKIIALPYHNNCCLLFRNGIVFVVCNARILIHNWYFFCCWKYVFFVYLLFQVCIISGLSFEDVFKSWNLLTVLCLTIEWLTKKECFVWWRTLAWNMKRLQICVANTDSVWRGLQEFCSISSRQMLVGRVW